jgi:pimeloyl-ACP methyl ester carboxylesterase
MRGRLSEGLGLELLRRGFKLSGRELSGDFLRLRFKEQVDTVMNDLAATHWSEGCRVIANSFGAYIFLHAQAQLPPYVGRVLLLSPILGSFGDHKRSIGFIPPRSDFLRNLAEKGAYPTPKACEIHVGANDWQSDPVAVKGHSAKPLVNPTGAALDDVGRCWSWIR